MFIIMLVIHVWDLRAMHNTVLLWNINPIIAHFMGLHKANAGKKKWRLLEVWWNTQLKCLFEIVRYQAQKNSQWRQSYYILTLIRRWNNTIIFWFFAWGISRNRKMFLTQYDKTLSISATSTPCMWLSTVYLSLFSSFFSFSRAEKTRRAPEGQKLCSWPATKRLLY